MAKCNVPKHVCTNCGRFTRAIGDVCGTCTQHQQFYEPTPKEIEEHCKVFRSKNAERKRKQLEDRNRIADPQGQPKQSSSSMRHNNNTRWH